MPGRYALRSPQKQTGFCTDSSYSHRSPVFRWRLDRIPGPQRGQQKPTDGWRR